MTEIAAGRSGHFATIVNSAMDRLDKSIQELSKQVGISCEHARKLQAGKALPDELLVEKIATAVGVYLEQLRGAAQRDRMHKKSIVGAAR
jgi:ribosome-binding protein aMBF1 (putative translation factor)